ncbi:MAG: family 10 glycosylhydrolase, partial [Phycisphaerae bacterium]|nr:family 10 glycosylhydrolase [Phycisphaerae bacterium]
NRLEFHAYINTHVAWRSREHELPAAASHIFYQHFNAANPSTCDWLAHNAAGQPEQWGEDDYCWITPGVPDAQAYTRRQIMHVVKNYDVDGVHFDRIRTGGAEFSHDPISLARFANPDANPSGLSFEDWTTDQINRFVRDIYAQISEVKPHLKVSSAPIGLTRRERFPDYPDNFHFAVTKCHQDAQAWLAAGAMDFLVPQIYWSDSDGKPPFFSRVLPDWIDHAAGRHIYPGLNSNVGGLELVHEIQVTRRQGGLGNVIFSYSGMQKNDKFSLLSRGRSVYSETVPTPAIPWKENPTEGMIVGTILDEQTNLPVVDAQIRRSGCDEVALSSGDGFYSFLKVPPGEYSLNVHKTGCPELQSPSFNVAAGQVVRVNVSMAGGSVVAPAKTNHPTVATNRPLTNQPSSTPPAVMNSNNSNNGGSTTRTPSANQPSCCPLKKPSGIALFGIVLLVLLCMMLRPDKTITKAIRKRIASVDDERNR